MRFVPRVKRHYADMALREETRDLVRVNLIEEGNVVQSSRLSIRTEALGVASSTNEKKADVKLLAQLIGKIKYNFRPLRDTHVPGVNKYFPASQR